MFLGLNMEEFALSVEQQSLLQEVDLAGWLLKQSNPVAQRITGRTDAAWSKEDVRGLVKDVLVNFSATGISSFEPPFHAEGDADDHHQRVAAAVSHSGVQIVQILAKVIAVNNSTLKTSLPGMGIVSTPRYPTNPFRGDLATALHRVHVWRKQLPRLVAKMKSEEAVSPGVVLASAALYGGAFDADILVAIAQALEDLPETLGLASQYLYVHLSVAWRGVQHYTRRTWFPDLLTATLIARLPQPCDQKSREDSHGPRAKVRLWEAIRLALRAAGVDQSHQPTSLSSFLADIRIVSQLTMPSLVASYAAQNIRPQGLPIRTLERIYSMRPGRPEIDHGFPRLVDHSAREATEQLQALQRNPQELEPEWQKRLRKVLRQRKPWEARRAFAQLLSEDIGPHTETKSLILAFTAYLLNAEKGHKQLRVGTINTLVLTVIRHIGDLLQSSEGALIAMSRVSSEVLEDIYREAMELEHDTASVRKRVVNSLRAFHNFLILKYWIKPVEDKSLLSLGQVGTAVDANLITLEEYYKILEWLNRNWPHTADHRLLPLVRTMVILGFRCGLRRSEALRIGSSLAYGHECQLEILVRPSARNVLKTTSSKRRIPAFLLMPEAELMELKDMVEALSGTFGYIAGYSEQTLIPIIHKAIRAVTNDSSLKFHHLRHSFATWTLVRLMIGESASIPPQLRHLPMTHAWLEESPAFFRQIYDVLPHTTRMHAYLVAQMMGHSHPSITLQYYIHGMDWLLDMHVGATAGEQYSIRTLALASGLAERTAYNLAEKDRASVPLRVLSDRWPAIAVASPSSLDAIQSWPFRAWGLLHHYHLQRGPIAIIAPGHGFSADQSIGCLQRAEYLYNMRTLLAKSRWDRKGMQHGMMRTLISNRKGEMIACPNRPHLRSDIRIVDMLAPKLERLLQNQPDVTSTLRYYVDNIWKRHNQLFFRDPSKPDAAAAYIRLLRGMGINPSQLRISAFDGAKRSDSITRWISALGLPKTTSIQKLHPPNASSSSYDGWIGIEPNFSDTAPTRGNNRSGAYGFRFIMLMTYILYGETDTERICNDLISDLRKTEDALLNKSINNRPSFDWGVKRGSQTRNALFEAIRQLVCPGGLLYRKPHTECVQLFTSYFEAIQEMFPGVWVRTRKRVFRYQILAFEFFLVIFPDVLARCALYENSKYSLDAFKLQLLPVGAVIGFGDWRRSAAARRISRKLGRIMLLSKIQQALRTFGPHAAIGNGNNGRPLLGENSIHPHVVPAL